MSVDKKYTSHYDNSPYAFAANNPICLIDKDGDEPKWGQLGNLTKILGQMGRVILNQKIYGKSIEVQLQAMSNYFEANRLFTRNENGKLVDAKESQNVKRYIYTEKFGWIDMHHFFRIAQKTAENGKEMALAYAQTGEIVQMIQGKKGSAFSYEDMTSNLLGVKFWDLFGEQLKLGKITLIEATEKFLKAAGATDPKNAPNIEYIPHVINPDHTLTFDGIGLKGEELKERHKEVYDKRDAEDKSRIQEAHEEIND